MSKPSPVPTRWVAPIASVFVLVAVLVLFGAPPVVVVPVALTALGVFAAVAGRYYLRKHRTR